MLHLNIDLAGLQDVGNEIGASEKQIRSALSRALRRTEASLRKLSSQGLTKELALRSTKALRRRLKSLKAGTKGGEFGLWYGLNDLPVSAFKGRARKTGTGATFNGQQFEGAFVGHSKFAGKNTIFKRKTEKRLSIIEQGMPIEDKAIVFIEDEIFVQTEEIFWKHFRRDLAARVNYQLGEK
jgi:hypothetical protein